MIRSLVYFTGILFWYWFCFFTFWYFLIPLPCLVFQVILFDYGQSCFRIDTLLPTFILFNLFVWWFKKYRSEIFEGFKDTCKFYELLFKS